MIPNGELLQPVKMVKAEAESIYDDTETTSPFHPTGPLISVDKSGHQTGYVVLTIDAGKTTERNRIGKKTLWTGPKKGDIYGDANLKGNRLDEVPPTLTLTPHGWRIHGLNEEYPESLKKQVNISQFLREHGLPTEHITHAYQLTAIPLAEDPNKLISINEWKKQALTNLERELKEQTSSKARKIMKSAKKWLDTAKFAILERDLQVDERLQTLLFCKTREDVQKILEPIMNWVNTATQVKKSGLISETPPPQTFNFSDEDIKRYLSDWLPSQMGIYLGRMHKLGLAHHNLNGHNWSLVGTPYDLFTVTGIPAGNKRKPKEQGFQNDVKQTFGALDALFNLESEEAYIASLFSRTDLNFAKGDFLRNYMLERFGRIIPIAKNEIIKDNYFLFNRYWSKELTGKGKKREWDEITSRLIL